MGAGENAHLLSYRMEGTEAMEGSEGMVTVLVRGMSSYV